MRWSYSRAGTFEKCPYQFKLRYIDQLQADRDSDASDPLIVGTAMHDAIEQGVDNGVDNYHRQFPISDDSHIAEEIKIRALAPKVRAALPKGGTFELELKDDERFVGFIDYAAPVKGMDGVFDLFDFKYTNPKNADRYRDGEQLQVYAYYFEKLGFGTVRDLFYIIVPKTMIRQKKTETVRQFRNRLESTLDGMEPTFVPVPYDKRKVCQWMETVIAASNATEFPKNPNRLCDWCDYQKYCESEGKDTSMILPKNERRDISKREHVKAWVYGEPFTGKTVFADGFPSPIMLNTDGNIDNVTAPFVAIHDTLETEGRMTKTISGWETLKGAVDELEKGSTFETVVVDLLEDAYELCRTYIYGKRGWEHESDDSFRAYDIVRKEFFDLMRRVTNLPMNVVLISHEDISRDITGRSGSTVTAIKPNLADKVAKKIAGMVDIVGRSIVHDGSYLLAFKTEEFVFGGGRLNLAADEIPLTFSAFADVVGLTNETPKPKPTKKSTEKAPDAPNSDDSTEDEQTPVEEKKPVKRTRKRRVAPVAPNSDDSTEDEQTPVEEKKPVKRTRKRRVAPVED